jgi:flavin reductase (DIM6/NTAB) family NADH-FMN oxidoreductase RutF
MSVSPDAFRQVMRHWTSGIVIFAASYEGFMHGMTVSSFTSLTLEPPLVLASIQKGTRTHDLTDASNAFSITILSASQQAISDIFAGRVSDENDRFEGIETEVLRTGSPFIKGGLAYLDCEVSQRVDLGSHTIFIGEVVATKDHDQTGPLAYYDRSYRKLQE